MSKYLTIDGMDHERGAKQAPLTVIHYADYQCPFSGDAFAVIEKTLSQFEGKVRFVYRHFPLVHLHPDALALSQFAEAAGEQGHFWETHDFLFRTQKSLSDEKLEQFLSKLGLDMEKFSASLDSQKVKEKIKRDVESGKALGVHRTPTFILNGHLYQDEWHESGLKHQIERALAT
jgi:protein-disulfide isomerase